MPQNVVLQHPHSEEASDAGQLPQAINSDEGVRARAAGPDLLQVDGTLWRMACRRQEVIGPLLHLTRRTRLDVQRAAEELGCSASWLYELLKRYRADPRLTQFLPERCGRPLGLSLLGAEREALVRASIQEFYLTRQQASVSALMVEIYRQCRILGIKPPSRRAVQRRIDARSPAAVLALRRGKKAARDRFAPVRGSLRTIRALGVVQIDHTLVDVMLVDSLTREPIKRPWLTLAIDVHTRYVLGFSLSLDPPSAISVASVLPMPPSPRNTGWPRGRSRVRGDPALRSRCCWTTAASSIPMPSLADANNTPLEFLIAHLGPLTTVGTSSG